MQRILSALLIMLPSLGQAETVSYNRDIRPILSENCFFCHGFDEQTREGDLRLDTFEGATSGDAIVPGHPEKSEIIARIFSEEEDDVMPPHDSIYSLSKAEKETLTAWIKQGAQYEKHWAYQKVVQPQVPALADHPVDAFLKKDWQQQGVASVEKASPRNLLRRLSYDLRGLPPTPKEVAHFEADPSEARYLQYVDQWLNSLEHAEHQAVRWLDLVRWGNSSGMVSDEPIASGPYRKYVIESFHENTPFDQFTREQLAGDLFPEPTQRTLTASAYNRLVKTNSEAGVIEKEALYALKGEHVRALGTVWLGATTGCAECHDHKYDPISAKDYFSLAAFFDDLIEVGVYQPGDRRAPIYYLHDDEQSIAQEAEFTRQIDEVRKKLYESPIDQKQLQSWTKDVFAQEKNSKKEKEPQDWDWFPAELPPAKIILGDFEQTEQGRKVTAPDGQLTRHFAAEVLSAGSGKADSFYADVIIDPDHRPTFLAFQTVNGAYERLGWHRDYQVTYYWGKKPEGKLPEYIAPKKLVHLGDIPEETGRVRLDVPAKKFKKARYRPVGMGWIQQGGTVTWLASGFRTDAHRVFSNRLSESALRYFWELPVNRDDRKEFPNLLIRSLRTAPEKRREIHTQIIEIAFREFQQPELVQQLNQLYREAYHLRRKGTPTLVSKTTTPKKTHLLNRGNFMEEIGPVLKPAVPEVFDNGINGSKERLNRLDLANWILSPDNPLTARVFVNRLWHQFYGRGISETLEDAGNQGDWPSNLDLLNWLAFEFQQKGWDIKKIIRLLVTAESYQLSSIPDSLLAQNDPTNRLHTRQGRYRHRAEELRDSALAAAGILRPTQEIPVQSFFPHQPKAYWEKSHKIMYGSRYQIWETNRKESQHQRSLYTYWKRQNAHPSMLALDAPTRQECTTRRAVTNTPAQALALLNDPIFVEASRALAERLLRETTEENRIEHLYQLTLQRDPSDIEKTEVQNLHQELLTRFQQHPEEAKKLCPSQRSSRSETETVQLAAWTGTCRILLNLHEFLTRS